MPIKVVEVQPTPNPNALKFVLDRTIVPQPLSMFNRDAATGNPLAEKLFGIEGVASLLFLGDFITVNKAPTAKWADITPKVKALLGKES
jgi:hypothetical protein